MYVFGAALVISYVTFFMVNVLNFPSDMLIWFGILHMLGVCMMLFPLFKRLLGVGAGLVLGVGFVALGVWFESFCIPVNLLFPLGLRAQGFYCGGDYFPLLPGFGWFLLGAVIGRTAYRKKQSLLPRVNAANPVIRFFSFCGRHSLLIYMLHQPVLTIGTIPGHSAEPYSRFDAGLFDAEVLSRPAPFCYNVSQVGRLLLSESWGAL